MVVVVDGSRGKGGQIIIGSKKGRGVGEKGERWRGPLRICFWSPPCPS